MYDSFVIDEEGRCCRGRWAVLVSLHSLSMVDAQGVVTGVGVGIVVLEGFRWLGFLGLLMAWLLLARLGVGMIQVPGRRW